MTEIFFPQREALRLDAQNLTPRARRKVVYAGTTEKSHSVGSKSLHELSEWDFNATRVSELTLQAGQEMKAEQSAKIDAYHEQQAKRSLTTVPEVSSEAPANLPQVGVVEMDGGRIRTRQEDSSRGVTGPHWREFQAGCVVRLQSEASATDPRPEVPRLFLSRPKVQKLVNQLHRQRAAVSSENVKEEQSVGELLAEAELAENQLDSRRAAADQPTDLVAGPAGSEDSLASTDSEIASQKKPRAPVRLQRTCVATLEGADSCGRILAAESAQRGLNQAARKGFVGDGQSSIWSVWERYFKRLGFVPILDFIQLPSYSARTTVTTNSSQTALAADIADAPPSRRWCKQRKLPPPENKERVYGPFLTFAPRIAGCSRFKCQPV